MLHCKTLEDYLTSYGKLLGEQAEKSLRPLHRPGVDPLPDFSDLGREPFPAQQHIIAAIVQCLNWHTSAWLNAQTGTGKTLMTVAGAHKHAQSRGRAGYCGLIMCPGHLPRKTKREIEATIPTAVVSIIENWRDVIRLKKKWAGGWRPTVATWFVIGKETAKLGADWEPQYAVYSRPVRAGEPNGPRCPTCWTRIVDKDGNGVDPEWLAKAQRTCRAEVTRLKVRRDESTGKPVLREERGECGAKLWQFQGKKRGGIEKWEPAKYIHKHMKGFFDYFILDEAHLAKGDASAQGLAAGSFGSACKKSILATGTLIGGYANHVRPLLFRFAPHALVAEGLGWKDAMAFDKRYGRIETTVTTSDDGEMTSSHKRSRGGQKSNKKTERVRPGIMPTLFGNQLLGQTMYLTLEEIADHIPKPHEIIRPVELEGEVKAEYLAVEKECVETNKELMRQGCTAFLGAFLQTLLTYADYPWDWQTVGYTRWENGEKVWHPVVKPKTLSRAPHAKERQFLEDVEAEVAAGNQVWVYVQNTDVHDVQQRLVDLLEARGIKVKGMRSSVPTKVREEWIEEHGPNFQVIVSHPGLVETGLDLFDKAGKHNFNVLMFYQTGYNLNTMRQAGGRARRIGQWKSCRVYYYYYVATMQDRAMSHMGRKLVAARQLEGEFSSEGLAALGGDDSSIEMALAQSIDQVLGDETERQWATVGTVSRGPVAVTGSAGPPPAAANDFGWLEDFGGEDDEAALAAFELLRKVEGALVALEGEDAATDLDELEEFFAAIPD